MVGETGLDVRDGPGTKGRRPGRRSGRTGGELVRGTGSQSEYLLGSFLLLSKVYQLYTHVTYKLIHSTVYKHYTFIIYLDIIVY